MLYWLKMNFYPSSFFCSETLLRSCWHKTPTKRPTASEVVELLSNNPRLISPCIDVPLASVQVQGEGILKESLME